METIKVKITDYYKELDFKEDTHSYTVNGMHLPSVSKLIKSFTKPFNTLQVSAGTAKKRGISQQEVLAEWDATRIEACDRGHRVHLFGENYVWNRTLQPSCKQEEAVVKFWNEVPDHVQPVIMELQMYHKHFLYAGTCDILLLDKITGEFILGDYKTNKDLFKNYNEQMLLHPFDDLLDCPYNKYQIQLSFYQILFEQIGLVISSRKLIWLLKDGTYKMYDTKDFRKRLIKYLTERN